MKHDMDARGGGVDTMPCDYEGYDDAPLPSSAPSSHEQRPAATPPPSYDPDAEQRAWEQEQENLRRKEEAERKAIEEEKKRFIRERDAAGSSLKGGSSTPFGIKGNPEGDLQIKSGRPESHYRDLSTAWKQLHCAGSLSRNAIAVALRENAAIEEIRYLGNEAIKALNGDRLGVICPEATTPPSGYGQVRLEKSTLLYFYRQWFDAVAAQAQQRIESHQKLVDLTQQREAASSELSQLQRAAPTSFEVVDLAGSSVWSVPLLATTDAVSTTGKTDRLQVPLPPPAKPATLFWVSSTHDLPTEGGNTQAIRDYLSGLAEQAVRRYNLAQDAMADFLASLDPETRRRAAGLEAFWFQQSMQKAKDRLLQEEYLAIQAAAMDAYHKLHMEQLRQQAQHAEQQARRTEGAKQLWQASERIMTEHQKALSAATSEAHRMLKQEFQSMHDKGLLQRGSDAQHASENLILKEQNDPVFRQALKQAVDKASRRLDDDTLAAHQRAMTDYAATVEQLKARGLLPEPLSESQRTKLFNAYALQVAKEEGQATRNAREHTEQELAKEFQRLKAMEPQMLKRAEVAIREVDKLIRDYQEREQRAQRNLVRYQQAAETVLSNPSPRSLSIPEPE